MSHGLYIAIVIALILVLLLLFLTKRRMDKISDRGEMLAEDHLQHPEEPAEPVILPHVHPPAEPTFRRAAPEAAPAVPLAPPTPPPAPRSIEPAPVAEAAPLPGAPQPLGPPDDLTRLKGLGPRAQARLNELGIMRYDQLAALDQAEIASLDAQMGSFAGRLRRDRWVDQARLLATGDTAAFEAAFGKLG